MDKEIEFDKDCLNEDGTFNEKGLLKYKTGALIKERNDEGIEIKTTETVEPIPLEEFFKKLKSGE